MWDFGRLYNVLQMNLMKKWEAYEVYLLADEIYEDNNDMIKIDKDLFDFLFEWWCYYPEKTMTYEDFDHQLHLFRMCHVNKNQVEF